MTLYGHFYLNKRQPSCDSCFCHGLSRWSTSAARLCPAEKAGRYSFYRPALQTAGYSLHLLPLKGFYGQSELLLRDFLRTHPQSGGTGLRSKKGGICPMQYGPRRLCAGKNRPACPVIRHSGRLPSCAAVHRGRNGCNTRGQHRAFTARCSYIFMTLLTNTGRHPYYGGAGLCLYLLSIPQ